MVLTDDGGERARGRLRPRSLPTDEDQSARNRPIGHGRARRRLPGQLSPRRPTTRQRRQHHEVDECTKTRNPKLKSLVPPAILTCYCIDGLTEDNAVYILYCKRQSRRIFSDLLKSVHNLFCKPSTDLSNYFLRTCLIVTRDFSTNCKL